MMYNKTKRLFKFSWNDDAGDDAGDDNDADDAS